MNDMQLILKIVYAVVAFLVAAIPSISALIVTVVKKKKIAKQLADAKTEAEKAKLEAEINAATIEMSDICDKLIDSTEALYKDVSIVLKSEGKSAASLKKETVMTKLRAYAIDKSYIFDEELWSKKIDDKVALTKTVNAK